MILNCAPFKLESVQGRGSAQDRPKVGPRSVHGRPVSRDSIRDKVGYDRGTLSENAKDQKQKDLLSANYLSIVGFGFILGSPDIALKVSLCYQSFNEVD